MAFAQDGVYLVYQVGEVITVSAGVPEGDILKGGADVVVQFLSGRIATTVSNFLLGKLQNMRVTEGEKKDGMANSE